MNTVTISISEFDHLRKCEELMNANQIIVKIEPLYYNHPCTSYTMGYNQPTLGSPTDRFVGFNEALDEITKATMASVKAARDVRQEREEFNSDQYSFRTSQAKARMYDRIPKPLLKLFNWDKI